MTRIAVFVAALSVLVMATAQPAPAADLDPVKVRSAIERGMRYLRSQQNPDTGMWPDYGPGGGIVESPYPGAVTALATMALLNCGDKPSDKHIQKALGALRRTKPETTYALSVQIMALAVAEPQRDRALIARNVKRLEELQIKRGVNAGCWGYSEKSGDGDNSNAQFALLALHEAERVGVAVDVKTWELAKDYWERTQFHGDNDGAWSYKNPKQYILPATGTMTSAGVASLIIASGKLSEPDATVVGGQVECCGRQAGDEAIERGLKWLGRNFRIDRNPSSLDSLSSRRETLYHYYYLYGIERVGRMTARRFIGDDDWYRRGAEALVKIQDSLSGFWKGGGHGEENVNVTTSLALLFLSKGRRPVLIAKLQHAPADDWNRHRHDLDNLTRYVEKKWTMDLTWQLVDLGKSAAVEDLLQSPVLWISGRDGFEMTAEQKKLLRAYVDRGGFIFAEDAANRNRVGKGVGRGFDKQFTAAMEELFEASFELLPAEHPIWSAEEKVDPKLMPALFGIKAGCRTSVVYCPSTLSCFWELARAGRDKKYPPGVQAEIDACHSIGVNVLAYATNRELKRKDEIPTEAEKSTADRHERGTIYVAKLRHPGGCDEAPLALTNLLREATTGQLKLRVSTEKRLISITDKRLFDYSIVFMHGRSDFKLSDKEREALRTYLERGGFLFADAISSNESFAAAFRREMAEIFPQRKLERIPSDLSLIKPAPGDDGHDISSVTLREPVAGGEGEGRRVKQVKIPPLLEGIKLDDRYAVIFSPYDVSCALQSHDTLEFRGYSRDDAKRIGLNVLLYSLQQ